MKPYLYAGPAVAFNLSNEAKLVYSIDSGGKRIYYHDWYEDKIFNAKGIIFEAIAGAGLNIKFGNNSIVVEARYKHGIGRVFDDVADPDAIPDDNAAYFKDKGEGVDLEHKVFAFSIGYNFTFGL